MEPLERLSSPKMEHYKKVYAKSPMWDGKTDLHKKRICVYCEQGFGDIIQFARYFQFLKERGAYVILHCPKELHRLMGYCIGVKEVFDKESEDLPEHDLHVLSMSVPFLLNRRETHFSGKPYITVREKTDVGDLSGYRKIGVSWEGNPHHSNNLERSCPLRFFRNLQDGATKLFLLNKEVHLHKLVDYKMELYSAEITDFLDTAKLINSMDMVVSVDTAVLHLAGAMNKRGFGLLSHRYDPRWDTANWYPVITLIKQVKADDWLSVFMQLRKKL